MSSMSSINFYIPNHHLKILTDHANRLNMPLSRVISYLIDNALEADITPDLKLNLPASSSDHEYQEYGNKLMNYMKKKYKGTGLDMLLLLRHEMGIPDRNIFLTVFSECLELNLIESYPPDSVPGRRLPHDYVHYRYKQPILNHSTTKKIKNRANEYAEYLKLKKKYEREA